MFASKSIENLSKYIHICIEVYLDAKTENTKCKAEKNDSNGYQEIKEETK